MNTLIAVRPEMRTRAYDPEKLGGWGTTQEVGADQDWPWVGGGRERGGAAAPTTIRGLQKMRESFQQQWQKNRDMQLTYYDSE